MFTFSSEVAVESNNEIFESLPLWKTHVLSLQKSDGDVPQVKSLKLLVDIKTKAEFRQWLEQFQDLTKTTYSVRSTNPTLGKKTLFKQRLACQHNTRHSKIHNSTIARKTKNLNCPSKITVTIHTVPKRYRGKDKEKGQLYKEMPCELDMVLQHNHSVGTAASLRYRKPSKEVKEKLISLFNKGHSPATAVESIKREIQLNCADYKLVLADRSRCPDYGFCYVLYTKIFKKKFAPMDFNNEGKLILQQILDDYNCEAGTVCAKMVAKEQDYVICICTPLMQRVHKHVETASKLVLMDSQGSLDQNGSRIFVLLTHSDCGGLPLGVIIVSSESCDALEIGLQLLKEIVGEDIFGRNMNGPSTFLTDDSLSEQNAIRRCFPNSKVSLSPFHVLQTVWRWLVKAEHGVSLQQQCDFFQCFKRIMFARTVNEALVNYGIARANIGENHPNFLKYLEVYWHRRDQWAISHRIGMPVEGHDLSSSSEDLMEIMKDKIFEKVRSYHVLPMVDFILTIVNLYFQRRLLDAANRPAHKSFSRPIKVPSQEVLENIQHINGDILLVPKEDKLDQYHIVNVDVLICSCVYGNTARICKHVDWASAVSPSRSNREVIRDIGIRRLYYLIATNEAPPESWLETTDESHIEDVGELVQIEVEELDSPHDWEDVVYTIENKSIDDENNELLQELQVHLADFTKKSPEEMNKGLKRLVETLRKTKKPYVFASQLAKFGEG